MSYSYRPLTTQPFVGGAKLQDDTMRVYACNMCYRQFLTMSGLVVHQSLEQIEKLQTGGNMPPPATNTQEMQ